MKVVYNSMEELEHTSFRSKCLIPISTLGVAMNNIYKHKKSYLIPNTVALILSFAGEIMLLNLSIYRHFNLSWNKFIITVFWALIFFGFFFIFGIYVAIKQWTSQLIIDSFGIEMNHDTVARNAKMQWNEIIRIEYRVSLFKRKEGIVMHSEKDPTIFVTSYRKNYLEAFQLIVSECKKLNPDVLIDTDLLERLDNLK